MLNLMKMWSVLRIVLNPMMVMNMKMRKNLHELEKLSVKMKIFQGSGENEGPSLRAYIF